MCCYFEFFLNDFFCHIQHMKTHTYLLLVLTVLITSACASSSSIKKEEEGIAEEVRLEAPLEGVTEVQDRFMEILNEDQSVTAAEKDQIKLIIKNTFERYRELVVLSNQKKSLLVKETLQKKVNRKKLSQLRSSFRNAYEARMNLMLGSLDEISKVLKLHPESANRFVDKTNLMWPIRDRAP
jgi:hypothetical protein